MKFTFFTLLTVCILAGCSTSTSSDSTQNQQEEPHSSQDVEEQVSAVDAHFHQNETVNTPSESIGSVSNGSLKNGRIVPFSGKNFHYFDSTSYLANRGFTHEKVLATILDAYEELDTKLQGRHFCIMECSHQHGGKLYPHRTHQNGMSVDFMMPKLKDSKPYYGLDNLGAQHYMLTFDQNGNYSKDSTIKLDFNTIALHILALQSAAKKNGLSIEKVIINTELKNELFATENGKKLKRSGIYFARYLSPLINSVHDDHFHVDFKLN